MTSVFVSCQIRDVVLQWFGKQRMDMHVWQMCNVDGIYLSEAVCHSKTFYPSEISHLFRSWHNILSSKLATHPYKQKLEHERMDGRIFGMCLATGSLGTCLMRLANKEGGWGRRCAWPPSRAPVLMHRYTALLACVQCAPTLFACDICEFTLPGLWQWSPSCFAKLVCHRPSLCSPANVRERFKAFFFRKRFRFQYGCPLKM